MSEILLTTTDNPWNPHTNYDEWLAFDEGHGYATNELLANTIEALRPSEGHGFGYSESDQEKDYLNAISRILDLNLSGKHTIIAEEASEKRDEPPGGGVSQDNPL